MIEETAQVMAVEGEFAWVETRRKSTCGGCSASAGCGVPLMQKALGDKRARIKTLNRAGARVGDLVVVGLEEHALLRGSLAVYAVPLLCMLVAAALADVYFKAEGPTILAAVSGLLAGFLWLKSYTRGIARDDRFQAVILRPAPAAGCPDTSSTSITL